MLGLGIDFGTSTTLCALGRTGRKPELAKSQDGDEVIPSVVAFTPQSVQAGKGARARRLIDPPNAIYSMKRILGKRWDAAETNKFREQYPFQLEQGSDGLPRFVTRAGKLSPVEVTGYLFAHLREFPALQGQRFERVAITVPAKAGREQREATTAAAARAGFSEVDLVEEPRAAALAYGTSLSSPETVAVYDLGGGTFDVAVLRFSGKDYEVLGMGGDAYLGGDDIDQRLAAWVSGQILERFRWDVRTSVKSQQMLLFVCEQAKVRLSIADETTIALSPVDQVLADKTITVRRADLDQLYMDLLQRTFVICDRVLADARLRAKEVGRVVMAGGSSYMPRVREGVAAYFGKPPLTDLPPDRIVAMGAAVHATSR